MAVKKIEKKAGSSKKEEVAPAPVTEAPATKKKRITLAPEGIVMAEEAAAKKSARKQTKAEAVDALKKKVAAITKEKAPKTKKVVAKKVKGDDEEEGSGSDNDDDASVDLDGEFSDDEDGNVKIPAKKNEKGGKKEKVSYTVLQLRHLPKEFEEPQLTRFFSQFGANVVTAFCMRSKRNHQSLGTAFVQFDDNSVLPTVIDECHGMLLGGRTVRARRVRINRPLPSKKAIQARMNRAQTIEARGVKLNRFDLGQKQKAAAAEDVRKVVGFLIKYSRAEAAQNERLKELGIEYAYDGFKAQLEKVHKSHFIKKEKKTAEEKKDSEAEEKVVVADKKKKHVAAKKAKK